MKNVKRKGRPRTEPATPWNQRLGKAVFIGGIAALFVYYYFAFFRTNLDAQRVVVPGSAELRLDKPGQYTIFHEYRSTIDGKSYDASLDLTALEVTVKVKDTGQPVQMVQAWRREKYNAMSRAGYSVYFFTIDRPGTYLLDCRYTKEMPPAVLAVSTGVGANVIAIIIVTFAVIILTGGITAALFILPGQKSQS